MTDNTIPVAHGAERRWQRDSGREPSEHLRPLVWTADTGIVLLDPDGPSFVRALSADGNVVLGSSYTGASAAGPARGMVPFVWDAAHGKREIAEALDASSIDRAGWTFGELVAPSKNGKVVVGFGTCGGTRALYRAVLPE